MTTIRRPFLRIWSFLRRSAAEDGLARELASHLSLLEEDLQLRRMTSFLREHQNFREGLK
jgi:hypothetical protein